ncbi:MAG: ABC transporter permease subunit [Promethearchaeota archaeon]
MISNLIKSYANIKVIYRHLILTLLIAISSLFIGSMISFMLINLLPGDPVAAYLAALGQHNPSISLYQQTKCQLGYCDPLIVQYFRYIGNIFTGDWGSSVSITRGELVSDLIKTRLPPTIELSILPMIIGIGLGIDLGRISSIKKGTWLDRFIQIFCGLGISIPVFFLGMLLQYNLGYKEQLFEPTGYLSAELEFPPFETGFIILDAILAGQSNLIWDYLWHLVLPGFCLSIATIATITWQTRAYMLRKSHKKTIVSNTIITGINFGFILMFIILLETTFGLAGFGKLFVDALHLYDYFVIAAILATIIIMFIIITLISNLLFILYNLLKSKYFDKKSEFRVEDKRNKEYNSVTNNSEDTLKEYLLLRLKSPLFILGAIFVSIFIFISLFPEVIATQSLTEVMRDHAGSWETPSSEHPLGQTASGGDVFSRTIWGISDAMLFGFLVVLIGLIGGIIFGFFAGKYNRWGYKIIMGFMLFFYIFPGLVLVLLFLDIFGPYIIIALPIIGILLIPNFTRAIANTMSGEIDINRIVKTIIRQIPLNFAIAILLYSSVGFLGFFKGTIVSLGNDINRARENPYEAPWASLWPGLTIFGIAFSLIIFHIGLQDYDLRAKELRKKILRKKFEIFKKKGKQILRKIKRSQLKIS